MPQTSERFEYDVFLSHSSRDKDIVREIANRLKTNGLKVWFDEWVLKPGDNIPAKIENGLEHSRVLVLCMSTNAFGSDWVQLEAGTFRFRDPSNKERRFIPLRLDETPIKGALAQFLYISWLPYDREKSYMKLFEACNQPAKAPSFAVEMEARAINEVFEKKDIQLDYKAEINAYAFSPDNKYVLTGAIDNTLWLCDLETGQCLRRLINQKKPIQHIAWSDDQRRVLIISEDGNAKLLDVKTGEVILNYGNNLLSKRQMECFRFMGSGGTTPIIEKELGLYSLTVNNHISSLKYKLNLTSRSKLKNLAQQFYRDDEKKNFILLGIDHSWVQVLAWLFEKHRALSGKYDNDDTFSLCTYFANYLPFQYRPPFWNYESIVDQDRIIGGYKDGTIQIWDVRDGHCILVLEGHTDKVESIALHSNKRLVLSGSRDQTIRLWDIEAKRCLIVLKTHTSSVMHVAWSADRHHALSGDRHGNIQVWNLSNFVDAMQSPKVITSALTQAPTQVQYTNAKVLLVGDSGVGKSGLSNYLAHGIKVEDNKPLPSTDGAWATHWPLLDNNKKVGVEHEIWLWDFAGQVDYRLVHQLFMDDTAAAVLVFNPQNENPFDGLVHWDRDLQKATRKPFAKLLAAGRIDRGGLVVSDASMKKFMADHKFLGSLHLTSAKTGKGCDELRNAIVKSIDWKCIPETTSPLLYRRIKQEILNLRDKGIVLIRLAELKQRMEMTLDGEDFEPQKLEAVISLLAGPGMIQRLDFGGFILLRPEVLSRYAAAVVRKVRQHPQEMGCIREDELLKGNLDYQDFERLPIVDEAVVLRTLLETFISRAWCLRQPCDDTAMLTFPNYFRRERKEQPSHPSVLVTYRFDGPANDIYATLVVRLHHTVAFENTDLWKSAADFKTQTGAALGFTLARENDGASRLDVYFEPDVDQNSRVLFLRYIHEHLSQLAQNVVRLRHYSCTDKKCDAFGQAFTDHAKITKALAPGGKGKVFCSDCGKSIILHDIIEEKFYSSVVIEKVHKMQSAGQVILDNESRELILVGHAFSIVAEAGQIYRGYTNSDHGIDGEIEFKDNRGCASGRRLYMQLKSGDSYLNKRKNDGTEIFQIKNPRWADYWQHQAYAVMLVIRTSDGEIRWMDVSTYLKRESKGGKTVKQVVFEGEHFDVMSVRRWREIILSA